MNCPVKQNDNANKELRKLIGKRITIHTEIKNIVNINVIDNFAFIFYSLSELNSCFVSIQFL